MKYAYIAKRAEERAHPVEWMCRLLEVARSGYYKWVKRGPSERTEADAELLVRIRAVHRQSHGTYGVRRVWNEVRREQACSRAQVERLMRTAGLRGKSNAPVHRRRPAEEEPVMGPLAGNLLGRKFGVKEIGGANRVWASDITYVPTRQGWLYLAVVLDLGTRAVVGWSMGASQTSALVLDALEMAVQRRKPPRGLLHHSDRGCQYTSHVYQDRLARHGMRCSLSRKGNCWDNAVVESFFATLEAELIEGADWHTHNEARRALFAYVEGWYNRRRRHSSLGYLSPLEYERRQAERACTPALPDAA